MDKEKKKLEYRELQRFREWDVFVLLGLFGLGLAYRAIAGFMGWWGAPATSSLATYVLLALVIGILLLYYCSIRVLLVVNKKGVSYQFYPWHFRKHKINWEEIAEWEIVDIPLRAALTGWSVDFSGGKCYSVTGHRKGLILDLKDGKRVFISSRKPGQLRKVIRRLQKRYKELQAAQIHA